MNYNEALNYIHSLGMFSHPAGLGRIKKVLAALGNPQNSFKSIHIAGTNGKGSVCALVSSVFKAAGFKTGSFISPFIIDFRERIQINGEYISEGDLISYTEIVKGTGIELTEFEFVTALAFLYFKEKNIDILVCETGLGGRFDATNTLENLACTAITKIGLDHTAVLGDSLEEIAMEKCGILRDCPTVTTPNQPKAALAVIKREAKSLVIPDINETEILNVSPMGNTFIYKGERYETALCGEYQLENALVSIEAIKKSGYNIPYNTIYIGLKSAFFPARLERLCDNPVIVLDGAHNPDGATALGAELRKLSKKPIAVIGMMRDKNVKEVLSKTLSHCEAAIATTVPNNPRAMASQELKKIAFEFCECIAEDDLRAAIAKAKEICGDRPIFIFGSLYLASAVRPLLKKI